MARLHGQVQGNRRHAAKGPIRQVGREAGKGAGARDCGETRADAAAPGQSAGKRADGHDVEDDRLRLVFTCCHPSIVPDAQVALTLREVCGLTTEEIARAFLTSAANACPADCSRQGEDPRRAHSLRGPFPGGLPERLDAVLRVIYLVFNEGYSASSGDSLTRHDLSARGHPPGQAARRAAARARGRGAARA